MINGEVLLTSQLNDFVNQLAWSADNQFLAFALASGDLAILDVSKQQSKTWKAHQMGCLQTAWIDTKTVISTGQDGKIKIWNTIDQSLICEIFGDDKQGKTWVEHLAVSNDLSVFATSSGKHLKIWDKKGTLLHHFSDHSSTISGIQFSEDSKGLVSAAYGMVNIFNLFPNFDVKSLNYSSSFLSISWSPDEKSLAAGTQNKELQFWQLPYKPKRELRMSGYQSKIKIMTWSNNSRYLFTPSDDILIIWDVKKNGSPQGSKPQIFEFHENTITQIAMQKNGNYLATADKEGWIIVWDYPEKKEFIWKDKMLDSEITALKWAKNGNILALAGADGELRVINFS